MRIAFCGGGVMGEAIIAAILERGLATAQEITVGEPVAERRQHLAQRYGIATSPENGTAIKGAEVVILATKPLNLVEVMADLKERLRPDQLALSIVAGATLARLQTGLDHDRLVRAMPNTPAQIGAGISIWTATEATASAQLAQARSLLATLGDEVYVAEEKYLDMATAVSGSGPAYVFLFIEALTDAAIHIGLPRDLATRLAQQTVFGSALFAQKSGQHPAELRQQVSSPGGTTVEGVLALEGGGLRASLTRAVIAAYQKAKQLGA